jgi:acetyl esterase/lipase
MFGGTQVIVVPVLLAILTAICVVVGAWRSGISVQAWLLFLLVPLFAPKLDTEAAMMRAIKRDREKGPGRPPNRLLKHFEFSEEWQGSDLCFRLSKGGKRPLRLLYLHGGAYILEVQPMQWMLATGLLDRLGGEAVASIYPLAPKQAWLESMQAVERVYLNLVGEIGAGNVVIVGDSAGGGLALLLAQRLRDTGQPLPAALVLFSPWLDVGVAGRDQPALEARDPALTIDFLRRAGKLWAKGLSSQDPRVSPLYGSQHGLPPTIVFSGTRDILDSDALRLAHLNPAIELRHYRNMMHVWPCAPIPEAKRALGEAAEFIERALSFQHSR